MEDLFKDTPHSTCFTTGLSKDAMFLLVIDLKLSKLLSKLRIQMSLAPMIKQCLKLPASWRIWNYLVYPHLTRFEHGQQTGRAVLQMVAVQGKSCSHQPRSLSHYWCPPGVS
jgi:hypothetical protein